MISLVFTSTSIIAGQHKKTGSKVLFAIPFDTVNSSFNDAAAQVRAQMKKTGVRKRRVSITLLEGIVFKEFTHLPTTQKAVAGFALLEARTVLREQASSYIVSHIDYGQLKNTIGEETGLLLATPLTTLKSIQQAFAMNGFKVDSVHSGFDTYSAACSRVVLSHMSEKPFVSIDFGLDYTLINVYKDKQLASQRRLHGLYTNLASMVENPKELSPAEIMKELLSLPAASNNDDNVKTAVTSFLWDVLRTVRVVCAPLAISPEAFFISGSVLKREGFKKIIKENIELECTFADEISLSAINCNAQSAELFLSSGAAFSTFDLLSPIRVEKKNVALDFGFCATITAIVLLGMLAQPFAISLNQSTVAGLTTRYEALTPLKLAIDELGIASSKLAGIEQKQAALRYYSSNAGETLINVQNLFAGENLKINTLSYDGLLGTYNISFTASTKEVFLKLKDTISSNDGYFLNLNLSSSYIEKENNYSCVLSFTPPSHSKLPEIVKPIVPQPVDTDLLS